jgi:hypothetical protein
VSAPVAALRAGAVALLAARGEGAASAIVASADVEIVGAGEVWSIGVRQVAAHRVALVVDAPAHAALSSDPSKLAAIRSAFEAAMATPETALLDLALVLRLPAVKVGWHRAYRDVVPSYEGERPDPAAVRFGAAALLDALEAVDPVPPRGSRAHADPTAAEILRRATLEVAEVSGTSSPPLVRYAVRLEPPDLAFVDRAPHVAERLRRAVHDAGTRAAEAVASVELCVALKSRDPR